jgi:pyrroloquinoline quinone (PQQ) biosynthesis protein C
MCSTIQNETEAACRSSLERICQHPFIVAAHAGNLSLSQAARWIKCAGRESRSFPTILENIIEFISNPAVEEILARNLADENGNGDPEHAHFRHYLHLLDDLGIPRTEFYNYKEGAGIRYALSVAYNISKSKNPAMAVGYMLVNEGMTPITYEAARSALIPFYPNLNKLFFDKHIEVDVHHVAELYEAINYFGERERDDLTFGILIGERGMAALLDEAYGVVDPVAETPEYDTTQARTINADPDRLRP